MCRGTLFCHIVLVCAAGLVTKADHQLFASYSWNSGLTDGDDAGSQARNAHGELVTSANKVPCDMAKGLRHMTQGENVRRTLASGPNEG